MSSRKATCVAPLLLRKFNPAAGASFFLTSLLVSGLAFSIRAQEAPQAPSVVEAARNARERATSSGKHPKVFTNADLGVQSPVPSVSTFSLPYTYANAAEAPTSPAAECDNPQAQRLRFELQAAEQDLDYLRRDLQYNPPVVSGNDLDLQYFKPGNSGLDVGSPPLLDDQPPAAARVREVELEERIDSLQKALRLACEPPEAAGIQSAIYDAEQELNLLQRQFALDQDNYFSNPNYVEDSQGKAWLDAEQQQIQALQVYIERLREDLAVFVGPQIFR
jgi:hypothetical protein